LVKFTQFKPHKLIIINLNTSNLRLDIRLPSTKRAHLGQPTNSELGLVLGELDVAQRPPLHEAAVLAVQVPAARLVVLVQSDGVLAVPGVY